MVVIQQSQKIDEYIKPISTNIPAGEDIAKSDDPVDNAAYTELEMEITRLGDTDYQKVAQMALYILLNKSKHLRIAVWLCLSWYRIEGVEGLKNGLLLILKLLQTFSEKLFPEKEVQRSKAIQFINQDKRFYTLEKIEIINPEILHDIQNIIDEIVLECKKQFPDFPPDLSKISQIVKDRLYMISANLSENIVEPNNADQEIISNPLQEKIEPVPIQLDPQNTQEHAENQVESKKEPIQVDEKFILTKDITDCLNNIKPESPCGYDIENIDNQDALDIYMILESEILKYSNNNYSQCIIWARDIMQNHSKHLRVAIWLLISWFRIENLEGFRNGLLLILEMLRKFVLGIFPTDLRQKSRILQSLNTEVRLLLIKKVNVDKQNAELFIEIDNIFTALKEQIGILFKETPPKLEKISEIINNKKIESKKFIEQHNNQAQPNTPESQADLDISPRIPVQNEKTKEKLTAMSSSSNLEVNIKDEKNALLAIKKAIEFYFQDVTINPPQRTITKDVTIYGLSRVLRWTKLKLPPSKDHITQIEGPNEIKVNYILKLYNNKDWDTLVPDLETNFIKNDVYCYWLDAQRYIIEGLEQKGEEFKDIVFELKNQLARLILKLPDLVKLKFKDAKTPFASKETQNWIKNVVENSTNSNKVIEKIIPPIVGEEYDEINKIYESACQKLPENFSANVKQMQQSIDSDNRKKGRFLRLLNLANYCYLAQKYSLAQPLFGQLMDQIEDYHISEWETALCVAVWQSTYLNNQKLLLEEKDETKKDSLGKKQIQLFEKIVKYDAVLALTLESHIQED